DPGKLLGDVDAGGTEALHAGADDEDEALGARESVGGGGGVKDVGYPGLVGEDADHQGAGALTGRRDERGRLELSRQRRNGGCARKEQDSQHENGDVKLLHDKTSLLHTLCLAANSVPCCIACTQVRASRAL